MCLMKILIKLLIVPDYTLNISYILYLCFLKKSIQWQCLNNLSGKWFATCILKNNTHTLEILHLFLGSNYKFAPCLKKLGKVQFIIGISGISILIKCNANVALNSILISHQNSITKTPFAHFISLRRLIFVFLCLLNVDNHFHLHFFISISAESHVLLLCHFLGIYFSYVATYWWNEEAFKASKIFTKRECYKHVPCHFVSFYPFENGVEKCDKKRGKFICEQFAKVCEIDCFINFLFWWYQGSVI